MRIHRAIFRPFVVGLGLCLGAAGCATESADEKITDTENLLAAAGFSLKPATTPAQQANIDRLPPHKLFAKTADGTVRYLYADPTVCRCLYSGTEQAYQAYRRMMFEQKIAEEKEWAAQMNEDAAVDWSAWGPWPGYP